MNLEQELLVGKKINELEGVLKRAVSVGLENALAEYADQISKERMTWLRLNSGCFSKLTGSSVRRGMELVLFRLMKLDPKDVPIQHESREIVTWRSSNFCPYLEASQQLGLDTGIVCRLATEAPVQALLGKLNPKLKFSRNYESGIRPYNDFCEETIRLAISQRKESAHLLLDNRYELSYNAPICL